MESWTIKMGKKLDLGIIWEKYNRLYIELIQSQIVAVYAAAV